jgi:DNA-directed RNA polymerase specialized sigma24 family protein
VAALLAGEPVKEGLRKGDKGEAVKTMQKMLIACGYSCGADGADGDFGKNTQAGLTAFQTAAGLTADGVYDETTKAALEKAYAHFDSKRGVKITTFLSTLVHNEIVDELDKESRRTAEQRDVADVITGIRRVPVILAADDDEPPSDDRVSLIPRLRAAIERLSPSDQVILNYYLEDKSSYIARSVETLKVSENYVSVRRNRLFSILPKLMEMTRSEYLRFCYEGDGTLFSSEDLVLYNVGFEKNITVTRSLRPNPILPSLNLDVMAERLAGQVFADLLASNLSEE